MRKRLILAGLGVMAVLVGVATFAANTAQWVNVTARVEKEIEIACVVPSPTGAGFIVDPDGCHFGVTFPENVHEKVVEVTLSNSFFNQHVKSSVLYDVLWECKLQDENALPSATNRCREDIPHDDADLVFSTSEGKWVHGNRELDGNIRDYIQVRTTAGCMDDPNGPGSGFADGGPGKLEYLGSGTIDRDVAPKCFYHLTFTPPACEGHWNPLTDPGADPKTVKCHEITQSPDPQDWDRFAELGDNFKIQVYDFGLD